MKICDSNICTGCGMCVNLCPQRAIVMQEGKNGFVEPIIDDERCINCQLCVKKCPANISVSRISQEPLVYAAWNRNRNTRKISTSGGVFSLLAQHVLKENGVVVGVKWTDCFQAEHCFIEKTEDISLLYGSKYVQSNTKNIYSEVKHFLELGRMVLFSGTPCQNHALNLFLNKEYEKLIQVDLVCHGVPSQQMLERYISEHENQQASKVSNIRLRYKAPYWDFCDVRIDFEDGKKYSVPTVDDPYVTLFNFGYSLRGACHHCQYTHLNRMSDITLMDFWNFSPKNFKMCNYNGGVSGLLINSKKGQNIFEQISSCLKYEQRTIEQAVASNKCLSESFNPDPVSVEAFWNDYRKGEKIQYLHDKYISEPFKIPSLMFLRRMKRKYGWIIKK